MSALLGVSGVTVRFGGVTALDDVGFEVRKGEFLSLIGPNGAGKTTMLRVIAGLIKPRTARVVLDGRDISSLAIHQRVRLGLALTHQIVRPLRSMTVLDNVALAVGWRRIGNPLRALVSLDRRAERVRAREILDFFDIGDVADKPAAGQPLGVLKRLEAARALALGPKLLLLDEPLAGLNSVEAARLADAITKVNNQGITVVMIEHNLGEVLRVSRRLVVLDNGRKIADGDPGQVMRESAVRAAYVGKEKTNAAA
ncbi:MAG: ATP-binding cassette domain-containing protein [Pseudomonadota bacterium]